MATDADIKSRRAKSTIADPRQLKLFEAPFSPPSAPVAAAISAPSKALRSPARATRQARRQTLGVESIRTIGVEDLPAYPTELIKMIDAQIKAIPTDRILLTYREIQGYFGISRATVIRRLKDGLVPGIRIAGERVVDDGPVRRLDRMQVRWLLLAVRSTKS